MANGAAFLGYERGCGSNVSRMRPAGPCSPPAAGARTLQIKYLAPMPGPSRGWHGPCCKPATSKARPRPCKRIPPLLALALTLRSVVAPLAYRKVLREAVASKSTGSRSRRAAWQRSRLRTGPATCQAAVGTTAYQGFGALGNGRKSNETRSLACLRRRIGRRHAVKLRARSTRMRNQRLPPSDHFISGARQRCRRGPDIHAHGIRHEFQSRFSR